MSSKSGRQLLYTPVIKGTIILTIAGLLCRILGFYYRIFLNSHIGSYGMGMLQLVLPLCGIAFSVCMCGFNSAISKYTAQTHGNINVLLGGLLMSFPLSCIFSAVCATFSYEIADKLMFNADCAPLIQIIAIGIPLSAIHSCICGYYYGCKKTFIPAISQIIEQLIRIFSVIIYYHLISENLETLTVTDALYGNIAGEVCADIFCIGCVYVNNKQNNKNNKNNKIIRNNNSCSACKTSYIRVIALYALPLNLNSLLLHLFESVEAILIPAQLIIYGLSKENAVSTYGIISGMTLPLLLFPSAITNSMSVMLLPKVSEDNSVQRSSSVITTLHQSVNICMHLGIMSCVLFILYIGRLGATLFHEPSVYNYTIILACICPFLYVKTSLASILNGLNMTARTCAYSITGLAIRIASLILLVPGIGISGYIYGLIISNILVCTLHYIKLYKMYHFKPDIINNIITPLSLSIIAVTSSNIALRLITSLLSCVTPLTLNSIFSLCANILLSCLIYIIIYSKVDFT